MSANDDGVKGRALLKEAVSALIGLTLLYLAWSMLTTLFSAGGAKMTPNSDELLAYGRQKDVLTIVLGLFGTVTGYYLGRVPAEARAEKAEQSAKTAHEDLKGATDRAVGAGADAARAGAEASKANAEAAKAVGEKDRLKEGVRRVRDALHAQAPPSSRTLSAAPASPQDQALAQARDRLDELLA